MPTTPKAKKTRGKVGPLPIWGWAAVGAGVFGVYTLYRRHNANLAAAGATTVPLGVGTATSPGTTGATSTSASITGPTIENLRAKFLAQATAKAGGNLTQAQALDAWNKFISGQSLTGVEGQVTKNIIANLLAGGFIPAGVSTIVHIAAPTPNKTTAHTPTAVTPAYVPNSGGSSTTTNTAAPATTTTNKPPAKPAKPKNKPGTLPGPTVRGGQPLTTVVQVPT
jgi:hypothetical protein